MKLEVSLVRLLEPTQTRCKNGIWGGLGSIQEGFIAKDPMEKRTLLRFRMTWYAMEQAAPGMFDGSKCWLGAGATMRLGPVEQWQGFAEGACLR
jgi:hypothetical protein